MRGICVLCTSNKRVTYTLNLNDMIISTSRLGAGETCILLEFRFLDYFVYRSGNAPMIFLFH